MLISLENQALSQSIQFRDSQFIIQFDDPAYVRSDMIVLNADNRDLGLVFSEAYHHIGAVPQNIDLQPLLSLKDGYLVANRVDGSVLKLSAPLCVK